MTGRLFNPGHCRVCGPSEYAEKSERSSWKLPGPEFQYSTFHGVCLFSSLSSLASFIHPFGRCKEEANMVMWCCCCFSF